MLKRDIPLSEIATARLSERERLEQLRKYEILDSLPEEALDDITNLAAAVCAAPVSLISLVDENRQWFKARVGLKVNETPRSLSFCAHALQQTDLLIVPDATADPRFADNPLVAGEEGIRFYAGAPLVADGGAVLGTLCVIDRVPRELTAIQQQTLRILSRQVMTHLELRRQTLRLQESEQRTQSLLETALDAIMTIDRESRITDCNRAAEQMFDWERKEIIGREMAEILFPESEWAVHRPGMARYLEREEPVILNRRIELEALRADGSKFPIELLASRLPGAWPARFILCIRDLSEQRKAERALEESEARFRAFMKNSPAAAWIVDEKGRYEYANEEYYRSFEVSKNDLAGATIEDVFEPEVAAGLLADNREVMASRRLVETERSTQRADGSFAHFLVVKFPIFLPGKDPLLGGISLDISERKASERARRESEDRYRTLFEYAPDGILILDRKGYHLDANASMCLLLGTTREELIGQHAREIVVLSDVPQIEEAFQEITSGASYKREWRLKRKDGVVFTAEIVATLMPDGNVLEMVRDVTELKRCEERFRQLVDSNVQGIFFWKAEGAVSGANAAFLRTIGYFAEEMEAGELDWLALTPPEYAAKDQIALQEVVSSGACAPYEKEFLRRDGSRVPILVSAAAFHDSPSQGVCFVLDLTERKRLEERSLRAQRMESIGTLAGGIAHDLNNALAPVIMSLELLNARFTDPDSQNLLQVITASSKHGADMVRQVLSFARGVDGRRIEVQLARVVEDVQRIATETFAKNIEVRVDLPADLWEVQGDSTQLYQVLLNLCVNSRDAMPGGGRLLISAQNLVLDEHYPALELEAHPGPYVVLEVEDNGCGIPREMLEKIFDPFFTNKEFGQGTGLGLSTSLAIVKSHGGFIQVCSETGKGTKFRVHLPAIVGPVPPVKRAPESEMPHGKGELILVVDDEAAVRMITRKTLETFGYRVVLASDGVDAVAVFAAHQTEIAALLIDMGMPVMDGPGAIRIIRKMNPRLPIIAASGLATNREKIESGVSGFLTKPFTAQAVLGAIAKALAASEGSISAAG